MLWLSLELTIAWINRRSWNHVVLLINKRRRFDILGHPGFFERVPSVDSSPQCFWFWGIFIYHNNVPKQRWTKSSWDVKVPFVILRCQMYPNVSKKCFQQGGEYIYIYMYVCIHIFRNTINLFYIRYTHPISNHFFLFGCQNPACFAGPQFSASPVEDSIHDPEAASVEAWYREVWSFGKMWKNTCKNHTHTIHVWYIYLHLVDFSIFLW